MKHTPKPKIGRPSKMSQSLRRAWARKKKEIAEHRYHTIEMVPTYVCSCGKRFTESAEKQSE